MYSRLLMLAMVATTLACYSQSTQPKELKREETLRAAKLSEAQRQSIQQAIVKQLQIELGDDAVDLEKSALDTDVIMIDLNGDGKREVVAQAMRDEICSPTGNCSFWIFQQQGHTHRRLLATEAQLFRILDSRTNAFRDLELSLHGSAIITEWRLYKFNGKAYIPTKCWLEIAHYTKSGVSNSKPKIETCDEK